MTAVADGACVREREWESVSACPFGATKGTPSAREEQWTEKGMTVERSSCPSHTITSIGAHRLASNSTA